MSTYTVTIDVADFVPSGIAPRLAFVTFSRLAVDDVSGEIVTTAPISVRVTQTPATIDLEQNIVYHVRGDGISGVGTFYARASADCTLALMRDGRQVDPTTLQPVVPGESIAEALAELEARIAALETAEGIPVGSSYVDNGDGTYTPLTFSVTDLGDGTWSSTGVVVDNGDGTFNLAA